MAAVSIAVDSIAIARATAARTALHYQRTGCFTHCSSMTELGAIKFITAIKEQLLRLGIAFESKLNFAAGIAAEQVGTKAATATAGFNYSFERWN
jgi:hypothetical protein